MNFSKKTAAAILVIFTCIILIKLNSQETIKNQLGFEKSAKEYLETSAKNKISYDSHSFEIFTKNNLGEVKGIIKVFNLTRNDGIRLKRVESYGKNKETPWSITIYNDRGVFQLSNKTAINIAYLNDKDPTEINVRDEEKFKINYSVESGLVDDTPVFNVYEEYPEIEDEKRIALIKKISGRDYDKSTLTRKRCHSLRKQDLFEIKIEEYDSNLSKKSVLKFENIKINIPLDPSLFEVPKNFKLYKVKNQKEHEDLLLEIKK